MIEIQADDYDLDLPQSLRASKRALLTFSVALIFFSLSNIGATFRPSILGDQVEVSAALIRVSLILACIYCYLDFKHRYSAFQITKSELLVTKAAGTVAEALASLAQKISSISSDISSLDRKIIDFNTLLERTHNFKPTVAPSDEFRSVLNSTLISIWEKLSAEARSPIGHQLGLGEEMQVMAKPIIASHQSCLELQVEHDKISLSKIIKTSQETSIADAIQVDIQKSTTDISLLAANVSTFSGKYSSYDRLMAKYFHGTATTALFYGALVTGIGLPAAAAIKRTLGALGQFIC